MNKNNIKTEAMLEHLLLQNAITVEGFDFKTGETLYQITDRLKDVAPEIYYQMKIEFEDHMFEMIKRGPESMQWRVRLY
jgi:hypothetical protein